MEGVKEEGWMKLAETGREMKEGEDRQERSGGGILKVKEGE